MITDDLGRCYQNLGNFNESLKYYEKCKQAQIVYRGKKHPLYGKALFHIGSVLKESGKLNEALELMLECRDIEINYGIQERDLAI